MPGPPPRYRPDFPDEFLAEARRLAAARTTASHHRQRAHLVLLLHEQPALSNVEVAARLDVGAIGTSQAKAGKNRVLWAEGWHNYGKADHK